MDMIRKSLLVLVLLLVVVIAWIGSLVYFQNTNVDINPNASTYTGQLRDQFDLEELEVITERTEKGFPVSPEEFLSLLGDED